MDTTFDEVLPDGPDQFGQAQQVDGADAENLPFLDIDQYKDYRIPVKVDGQDLSIPLAEAVAGYQRQADYTRKTQELASQRQQLQEAAAIRAALEQDPKGTIDLLNRHYGISSQQADDQFGLGEFDVGSNDSWQDPVESRMRELDGRIRAFEEQQAQVQLQSTIQSLQNKYGDDFNPQEVVTAALQRGSADLEGVFKQIAFDRVVSRQREVSRQADDQRAAKQAAGIVSGGSSAAPASTDDVGPIKSISDAYFAAKRSMGG